MALSLPIPSDEKARLASVIHYDILDSSYEKDLDELTAFAASIFHVPIVLITILDEQRQWFKSNYGLNVQETERSVSFCQYTIMDKGIFEIEDAMKDERFSKNPLVLEMPNIRFYCGAPLINEAGFAMGSLALIDTVPRKLTEDEKNTLLLLTKQVLNFFELTMKKKELEQEKILLQERVIDRTKELEGKVSELEIRDKKLISLNSELSRFIYKLSHDLLGPIKSIQGLTNLALNESKEENVIEYLEFQQKSALKLDNTLVSLIKLISIKDPCDISKIDWKTVIEYAIAQAKKRVPESNSIFKVEITSTSNYFSDQLILEMMLEEFIVNSMQYARPLDSIVMISVKDEGTQILLEIIDNGIGIREEEREKIYEMFYKNEKSKGSGLGLYIARNIVEKMKGTILLESFKNQGTKFQIFLPNTKDNIPVQ
jgi:signal transduction histidine kinase